MPKSSALAQDGMEGMAHFGCNGLEIIESSIIDQPENKQEQEGIEQPEDMFGFHYSSGRWDSVGFWETAIIINMIADLSSIDNRFVEVGELARS